MFPVLQWEGKAGKLWALAMTSLENVTKRGEGRLWAAALGLSLRQCQRLAAGLNLPSPTLARLLAAYLRHGLPA